MLFRSDDRLPHRPIPDRLADSIEDLESLEQSVPALGKRLQELGHRMRAQAPQNDDESRFVHGGMHPRNVFVDSATVGFIDLDGVHTGSPMYDLGKMSADLRNDAPVREAFFGGYARGYARATGKVLNLESVAWWTAVDLIRRAAKPGRILEPDGPQKAERLMREATATLQNGSSSSNTT